MNKKLIECSLQYLKDQGAYATSILIYKKNELVFYHTNNKKFEDIYLSSKDLYEKCHLAKRAHYALNNNKSTTLLWDTIVPENEESHILNEYREKYSHTHGITFLENLEDDLKIGLTLVGRRSDINLPLDILANKRVIMNELTKIEHFCKFSYT